MERLWAPWRMSYIKSKKSKGCVFCAKNRERRDETNFVLRRGKTGYVLMNIFPYNNGHLMIAPYRHVRDFSGLKREEGVEMIDLLTLALKVLKDSLSPEGFNIGANLGKVAGAGIEDHLHLHVVPRWLGDTNYMPVVSSTKIMPELLGRTYLRLKKGFGKYSR